MKNGENAVSLTSKTDYYPFGMPMPNRNVEGNYRYKYQGQEKDSETGKEAFELRLWDARIGRWLTIDPAGQYASPYLGMGNDPINGIDIDGGIRVPVRFQKKYPLLAKYLKTNFNELIKNKAIVDALKKHGGFSDEEIKDIFTWGKGPKLRVRDTPGAYGTTSSNPLYSGAKFNIDDNLANSFENLPKNPGIVMLLTATILHETTHVGHRTGWFNSNFNDPNEEGADFERSAYGDVIYPSNALRIFQADRSLLPKNYTPKVTIIVGELEQIGPVEN